MSRKPFTPLLCEHEPEPVDTWARPPKWFGIWGARLGPVLVLIAKIAARSVIGAGFPFLWQVMFFNQRKPIPWYVSEEEIEHVEGG